ncbi:hypothetical protein AV530_019704 [Patagioenas fasciata monilis]|uniref:Uncharacterized protein n=1 Tax=Patagioenas fasciata monilis TaxID=372326 RepID=A0A1V4JEJ1_PATFA|nr:hypothetical protein AV530_019704 [Patagioenas fasciata monilis]
MAWFPQVQSFEVTTLFQNIKTTKCQVQLLFALLEELSSAMVLQEHFFPIGSSLRSQEQRSQLLAQSTRTVSLQLSKQVSRPEPWRRNSHCSQEPSLSNRTTPCPSGGTGSQVNKYNDLQNFLELTLL